MNFTTLKSIIEMKKKKAVCEKKNAMPEGQIQGFFFTSCDDDSFFIAKRA